MKTSEPVGMSRIQMNSFLLNDYKLEIEHVMKQSKISYDQMTFFLRFKDVIVTYHSFLYDSAFTCQSHNLSERSTTSSIDYGQVISFLQYTTNS